MQKAELLDFENRGKIYNYLRDNPGLHLHELARKLGIKYHTLRYHIQFFEKNEMVDIKSDGSYSRVYLNDKIGRIEKELFKIVRQKTPRHILLAFLSYFVCSQSDLSKLLEKHPTTIEHHLKKLKDIGVIKKVEPINGRIYIQYSHMYTFERVTSVNEKIYAIAELNIFRALIYLFYDYQKSFKDDKVFTFVFKRWMKAHIRDKKMNVRKYKDAKSLYDSAVDRVIKTLFDIFPPPYYF